ncbi:MAG: hypothetical protein JWO03_1260 [Bacteroidetes bacterium]|nr:hypothetical protein [Bacteroidota bacterium]
MNPFVVVVSLVALAVITTWIIKVVLFKPKKDFNSYNHFS